MSEAEQERKEWNRRYGRGQHLERNLEPGELRGAFPGFEVLHYRESEGMAELVARKTV